MAVLGGKAVHLPGKGVDAGGIGHALQVAHLVFAVQKEPPGPLQGVGLQPLILHIGVIAVVEHKIHGHLMVLTVIYQGVHLLGGHGVGIHSFAGFVLYQGAGAAHQEIRLPGPQHMPGGKGRTPCGNNQCRPCV